MRRSTGGPSLQSKIDQIRTGVTKKTDLGVKQNRGDIQNQGGKYQVVEKEKKFEEAGVKKKKRNYVMYESRLGTEKETDLKKLEGPPKPKPKPVVRPRVEEKIIQQRKRLEYLDNYQYHETKVIRNQDPRKTSIVRHQRLSDAIGGVYEEMTYQRQTVKDSGRGSQLYSSQTTKTTTRRGPTGNQQNITKRTETTSRTIPAQSRQYRQEVKASAPKRSTSFSRGPKPATTTTTKTTTTTTRTRSSNSTRGPQNTRGTTTTTTVRKVETKGQSSMIPRGRRH